MENTIGSIPEFTDSGVEEVKQADVVETPVTETETPAELPAVETPVESEQSVPDVDAKEQKQVQGLLQEREKLLKEIQSLRGQRREIKQNELAVVNNKIDDLQDVNPQDVSLIEKVIKSKGYITKEESAKMHYEAVKQEAINKFLDEFPEYKPENDPHDINWSAFQREFADYRLPTDPSRIPEILKKVHRAIAKVPSERGIPEKRQQVKIASSGSGGVQRSSPTKALDPDTVSQLRAGGFSDEDIKRMESRL